MPFYELTQRDGERTVLVSVEHIAFVHPPHPDDKGCILFVACGQVSIEVPVDQSFDDVRRCLQEDAGLVVVDG